MPIPLTCSCGAYLEIDDRFSGQAVNCPDCQQVLVVPRSFTPLKRTSGLALASFIAALVGAFTVVGTALAVLLGLLALRRLRQDPEHLTGRGFALAGVIVGAVLTPLTLAAFLTGNFLGLDALLRQPEWAGRLSYDGSPEAVSGRGFSLTRPSARWGVYRPPVPHFGHAAFAPDDLLLANPTEDLYVTCLTRELHRAEDVEVYRDLAVQALRQSDLARLLNKGPGSFSGADVSVRDSKQLPSEEGKEVIEVLLDLPLGGVPRTFLLRAIKTKSDFQLRVLAGGTRSRRFSRQEAELRKVLDSYHADPEAGRPAVP